MPMELNTLIVTKANEKRVEDNLFILKKEGYRLYPIEIPVDIRKTLDGESRGTALIKKVEWEKNTTTITYEFISLNSSN